MHGWIPVTVQVLAAAALIAAIGWRTRRWRLRVAAVAAALSVSALAAGGATGTSPPTGCRTNPAPHTAVGLDRVDRGRRGVLVLGWRGRRRWRRGVVGCWRCRCACSAPALAFNLWVGYFPTVQTRLESADRRTAAGPDRRQVTVDRDAETARDPDARAAWCR